MSKSGKRIQPEGLEGWNEWYYFKRAMEGDREAADRVIEYMKGIKKGGTVAGDNAAILSYEVYLAYMINKQFNEKCEIKPLRCFSAVEATARYTDQTVDAVKAQIRRARKYYERREQASGKKYMPFGRDGRRMLAIEIYWRLHDGIKPPESFSEYLWGKI